MTHAFHFRNTRENCKKINIILPQEFLQADDVDNSSKIILECINDGSNFQKKEYLQNVVEDALFLSSTILQVRCLH